MMKLFLPLCIFAATLAHAAASMTVSVEPKGVTKPQLTAATNSVFALVTAALGDLADYCNSTAQTYANSAQNAAVTESKVWGRSATNTVTRGYYDLSQQLYTLTQTERRNSTNALFQSVSSTITSSTNSLAYSVYRWTSGVQFYCQEYSANQHLIPPCLSSSITIGSSKSPVSQLTCALVGAEDRVTIVELFPSSSRSLSLSKQPLYVGSVFEFNITCAGLSSTTPVSFVAKVTFARSPSPYEGSPAPANVACVKTYLITAYFAASPAL